MSALFLFLSKFLYMLVTIMTFNNKDVQAFVAMLPKSIQQAKNSIGLCVDSFEKYVSCPTCHSLYSVDSCKIENPDHTVTSRFCSYQKFPKHPQKQHRKLCNTPLMKTIRTSFGTRTLYPKQLFCYQSIVVSLRNLLQRPGFFEKTEQWRKRVCTPNSLADIYDGRVWTNLVSTCGTPFFSLPYNFGLILNIDWFQPFKYSTYSIGAIYIAIANLPRHERYTTDNVLLIGIIPGPKDP